MPTCPECQFSDEKEDVFIHRVKEHTDAGDGESFDLYDEEVFDIYVDMAVQEARRRVESRDEEPTMKKVEMELTEMGVSHGVEEAIIRRDD